MIKYPFKITKYVDDGEYYLVDLIGFGDGYTTQADTLEEALVNAVDLIDIALEDYISNNQSKEPDVVNGKDIYYVSPSLSSAIPTMLRLAREKRGLSAPEVAKALGVPYQNYWRIEKGERKNLTISTLEKIVAIFGGSLDINFA
ncbi:type II toxin-antitoxin system HicB family antitoxin [Francisella tularensis]|uniref:type II toxin-antitoxin system HicB family antitoxin n=1 Tax=Francisella tularensis TaxID=263 RepID=UPI0008F50570|nr:type II toxin-antitoxin system HicB family antitoxin [Francisella tularensis]APA83278.1 hypothetical protein N894_1294 [Francisella tularensis subsp. novicida PA10-7858]